VHRSSRKSPTRKPRILRPYLGFLAPARFRTGPLAGQPVASRGCVTSTPSRPIKKRSVGSLQNLSLSHSNRVSVRPFATLRETVFQRQRRKTLNCVKVLFRPIQRLDVGLFGPQKPRVFGEPREISVRTGMRGGPGRTRTFNQTVYRSALSDLRRGGRSRLQREFAGERHPLMASRAEIACPLPRMFPVCRVRWPCECRAIHTGYFINWRARKDSNLRPPDS
jgi:hypothetical protein